MHKYISILLFFVLFSSYGQYEIIGTLSEAGNQNIQLLGFEGFQAYLIDETTIDQDGNFSLTYTDADYGMGYLNIKGDANEVLVLVLAKENVQLSGKKLSNKEQINFTEGSENNLLTKYTKEFPVNQNVLGAFQYLKETYKKQPHLQSRTETLQTIENEIKYLNESETNFLQNLPKDSYVKWFIPVRKMASDVSFIAQQQPELIPDFVRQFRSLQHDDERLYKSGLFKEALEGHFWLIEQSGLPQDEVFAQMKKSIDIMVDNLAFDDKKMNETGEYLFRFLESRKLQSAAEYLAVKLLNESSCTLTSSLENQLEIYRKMKPGNQAKNILFQGDVFRAGKAINVSNLDEIDSEYYLLAFGSSWCPACVEELPKLQKEYSSFQQKGVEIVMISLDTSKNQFQNFVKDFDFYAASDYKKWDTQAVKDYHVVGTPTLYLIDKNKTILLRPNSVEQAKNWIAQNL